MVPEIKAAEELIAKYYGGNPQAQHILLEHSRQVMNKALRIGAALENKGEELDLQFLAEAAMLHDIGIIATDTPDIHCFGKAPYLQHGLIGKEILLKERLPQHAEVCERHIGVGLTADEICKQKLPLPCRDMAPQTLEQEIISYADLFFSKNPERLTQEQTVKKVRKKLQKFGDDKVAIFEGWMKRFEPHLIEA